MVTAKDKGASEIEVRDASQAGLQFEVTRARSLDGWQQNLLFAVALSWSLFQLAISSFLILNSTIIRSIHLAFAVIIVYLGMSAFKHRRLSRLLPWISRIDRFTIWDFLLGAAAATVALYLLLDYAGIAERIGRPIPRDRWMGIGLMLLLLEAARRAIGPALPILVTLFSIYAFLGPYMPAVIAFKGISLDRFLGQITMSTEGIYGVPLGVSANIVFLFVLFGAMLERAGGGKYFISLATSLLGGLRGGPAKAAVVASGLTGMVSGSSVANAVTAGTFTIPLMKSIGFSAVKAAAIETAASVGGQLMPPIMGAAAFIMAEYLNVAYIDIVRAAIVPALTSYIALFYIVHLEACKMGLKGLPRRELPDFWKTLLSGLHYLIPLGVLIYKLVFLRHSAESSSFLAICILAPIMLLQHSARALRRGGDVFAELRRGAADLISSLAAGARNMVTVAIATASAGIIVGIVTMGLGGMITELVDLISGGSIFLMLTITALACMLLGMGLPTTANYIVMASLTAPVIVKVGAANGFVVPLIAAHMFVFYFGILADDTPPVGLAAYASAGIAKSNPVSTGFQAFFYDIRTAILPVMFIFNLEILLIGVHSWGHGLFVFATSVAGALAFAAATQGWVITRARFYEIAALLAAALIFFRPSILPRALGIEMDYRLSAADIVNVERMSSELFASNQPADKAFTKQLTPLTRRLISELSAGGAASDSLKQMIAHDLNRWIESEPIYQQSWFKDVMVGPEIERLIKENPVGLRRVKLNRSLLHLIWPDYIPLSRLTVWERRLGFNPKYFSFIVATGLWLGVYWLQRGRLRSRPSAG